MTKKAAAQLDREIKTALAKPDPIAEKYRAIRRSRHGAVLRVIRKPPVAVVMTDRNGRETLVVVTREMSRASEGPWRASVFWHDGPVGHVTRKTLGAIASELATDYQPESVRVVGDVEAVAWTSTDEFAEGARKAAEVQAWSRSSDDRAVILLQRMSFDSQVSIVGRPSSHHRASRLKSSRSSGDRATE